MGQRKTIRPRPVPRLPVAATRRAVTGLLGVASLAALDPGGRQARAQTAPADAATKSPREAALHEQARAEKELTWYVSHYNTEAAESVGREFSRTYSGVKVNVVRATAQVIFQRLMQDMKAGVPVCDVLSSTDGSHFEHLKSRKLLTPYRPENADALQPVFRNMDPDDHFQATASALIIIAYRSDRFDDRTAPTSWKDLLDPRYKGQIALGHPAYSGYVGAWAVGLYKLYGPDYFAKLKANLPQIGRSINDVKTMLDAGERSIGHDGDGPFRRKAHEGAPYRTVYPADGGFVVLAGSGILADSRRPNAARLFENFLLSRPAQQLLVTQEWAPPMRGDVPPSPGAKPLSDVRTIPVGIEDMKLLPKVRELWRDTFGS